MSTQLFVSIFAFVKMLEGGQLIQNLTRISVSSMTDTSQNESKGKRGKEKKLNVRPTKRGIPIWS